MAFLCDGTSDFVLVGVVDWLMRENFADTSYRCVAAKNFVPAARGASLRERLERTVTDYHCDLVICHRDAERVMLANRVSEIVSASQGVTVPVVPLVPVRMTEAWLLGDEAAIRSAANNANGSSVLNLPRLRDVEGLPDPKQALHDLLASASGLSAQRLAKFNVHHAKNRVVDFIEDFSHIRQLPSFQHFEASFCAAMNGLLV